MAMRSWAMGWLAALALAGCAETVWTKPGVATSERDAAMAQCEAFAEQEQEEDFVARIEDTQRGVTAGEEESVLRSDFRRHDERSRRSSLIASCMRGLGYIQTELPDAEGTGATGDGA
ncbi:MAG: hypothetical protein ACFCVH_03365 [Alphaproteobacteria bacterium]